MNNFFAPEYADPECFSDIDRVFADYALRLTTLSDEQDKLLFRRIAQLASCVLRQGHTCCFLSELEKRSYPADGEKNAFLLPSLESMLALLNSSEVRASAVPLREIAPGVIAPLVFDEKGRVWLSKYFSYEEALAEKILSKLSAVKGKFFPVEKIKTLSSYFEIFKGEPGEVDYQQLAVYEAFQNNFCIISGGPGTGKSTVASALLALELKHAPEMSVMLCAPTGKAQARLRDSIRESSGKLNIVPDLREKINSLPCGTLHSILGIFPDSSYVKYNHDNPLPADLIIADESSMISLSLMYRLFDALKPEARVVLLGDRFQLASVDAGSVLAELCSTSVPNRLSPKSAADFEKLSGFRVETTEEQKQIPVVELQRNYRAAGAPEIQKYSTLIKETRDPQEIRSLAEEISSAETEDFSVEPLPGKRNLPEKLKEILSKKNIPVPGEDGFYSMLELRRFVKTHDCRRIFAFADSLAILCAVRKGPYGVENMNAILRQLLGFPSDGAAEGLPVMILANKPSVSLYNGDVGFLLKENGVLKAFFRAENEFHSCRLEELPPWEDAFALTIHKSQGSGYTNVLTILPDKPNPVICRELLYTAVTRAKKSHHLLGGKEMIACALEHSSCRWSGLADRLKNVRDL